MRRLSGAIVVAMLVGAMVAIPANAASARNRSLWLTDDFTLTVYNVTFDGELISSFSTGDDAISSIAVDPADGTLWGAEEGSPGGTDPGKLVNYDRDGNVIREILASQFGASGTEGLTLTFDRRNSTLWVVDDPVSATGLASAVYNIARDGTLLSSFPTSSYDVNSDSPQGIAFDRFTDSLWITDNSSEEVYNVSLTGDLIANFPTNGGPFVTAEFPNGVKNVQGITVESSNILWITARDTSTVYRVTKAGDTVVQSFLISDVDAAASDPTGVALDAFRHRRN